MRDLRELLGFRLKGAISVPVAQTIHLHQSWEEATPTPRQRRSALLIPSLHAPSSRRISPRKQLYRYTSSMPFGEEVQVIRISPRRSTGRLPMFGTLYGTITECTFHLHDHRTRDQFNSTVRPLPVVSEEGVEEWEVEGERIGDGKKE